MKMRQEKEISFSHVLKDFNIKNFLKIWLSSLLGLAISIFIFFNFRYDDTKIIYHEIKRIVALNYVDDVQLNDFNDSISIDDWLKQLDPHTYYLDPKTAIRTQNQMSGFLVGIGVHIIQYQDTPLVIYVIPNGPADKENVRAGDRIIGVNGTHIQHIAKSDSTIQDYLLGMENSNCKIKFFNPKEQKIVVKNIKRGEIPYNSTSNIFLTNEKIGYAKFEIFNANSHQQLRDSLKSLQKRGMKALVLDLRNNGGGLLDQAVAIANEFLEDKKLIVYMEGKHRKRENFFSDGTGRFKKLPLYILINNHSASASEVLTAALQDHKRATIIGERSFGKGLVQESFQLSNKASFNITVARYYTPNGKSLQKLYERQEKDTFYGIVPNYYVKQTVFTFPNYDEFIWATDQAFYQQNWKKSYPTVVGFANKIMHNTQTDSFLYKLALGMILYGPEENEVLKLNQDAQMKMAIKLASTNKF